MAVNLDWGLAQQNPNVVGNYLQGQQQGNALREQAANAQMRQLQMNALQRQMQGQQEAGAALKTGDTTGAQNALIGTGQYEGASAIGKMSNEQVARAHQASDDLLSGMQALRSLPQEQRAAAAQRMLPALIARNPHINPQMLQGVDLSDTGLAQAEQQVIGLKSYLEMHKPQVVDSGAGSHTLIDPMTGQQKGVIRGAFTQHPGDVTQFPDGMAPGAGGAQPGFQPGDVSASAPPPAPPNGPVPSETVGGGAAPAAFKAAIRGQEAPAGQAGAGVTGPMTQFGQAHGTFQVMDPTGQALAQKLGIAWRPDLMRGTSPEAVQYQNTIGDAAVNDAWAHGGGDPAKAAAYYYGGSDQKLWGPKTRAYQQAIVSRMGAPTGQSMNAVATVGDQPAGQKIPGYTAVSAGPLWSTRSDGVRVNNATGEMQAPLQGHPSTPQELQAQRMDPNTPGAFTEPSGKIDVNSAATDQMIAASYNPSTIDTIARMALANGGKVPPLARGRSAAMILPQIYNHIDEIRKVEGLTAEGIVRQGITLKADAGALMEMTKKAAFTDAQEGTAKAAGKYALAAVQALNNTQYRLLNQALLAGRKEVGDPLVNVAISRVGTYMDETAKVIAGGNGGAAPTDSVRKDTQSRLSVADSFPAFKAVMESMNQEMDFRSTFLHQGVATISDRISSQGGNVPPAAGAKAPASHPLYTPQQQAVIKQVQANPAAARAPQGSKINPFIPTNRNQVMKLKPAQWFVNPVDGKLLQRAR